MKYPEKMRVKKNFECLNRLVRISATSTIGVSHSAEWTSRSDRVWNPNPPLPIG
jgi:hypothetical protein